MKVVIFIDWFTPAYKAGGPIQSILNLVNLGIEGFAYDVICSNKDLDGQILKDINPDEWLQFNGYTRVWYSSSNKKLISLFRQVSKEQPDIFFINGIYSVFYNFLPLVICKAKKKIISTRGMLHTGALSQKSFKKRIYLKLWKFLNIPYKHSFHATNEDEERFIKAAFGVNIKVFVAQNLPRSLPYIWQNNKETNSLKLVSIGLISPMKNYLEVIKSLVHCQEYIEYSIYGTIKDPVYWQQCLDEIKKLPANVIVDYRGDLPSAKIHEALANAHVFVLPSKSENFGHAIYEALTAGKPIVTSHNTPWNNLMEAKADFNISLENNYELSEAICSFARMDNDELRKWSVAAKLYAEKSIDIDQIKEQYLEMFTVLN